MNFREAAQQALEALRLSEPKARPGDDDYVEQGWKEHNDAIYSLRAALAKPEQEPVAWITPGQDLHLVNYEGFQDWVPLYTAQPKRKPLMKEDVEILIYENTKVNPNVADDRELLGYIVNAVRAIERAHGIGSEE